MPITDKTILSRLYFIAGCMFFLALAIVVKLVSIQVVDGDKYRALSEKRTIKNFTIEPKRGNLYSDDGSLLATSVTKYDIRFDALTPSRAVFEKHIKPLSDSLSKVLGKPSSYYQNLMKEARIEKNRYLLIARDLGYTAYIRIKGFPMLNLGPYKGGFIVEQETQREYPLGGIAHRSVGYEKEDGPSVGLEGAFGEFLRGVEGHRLKQKIAQGQWKPITDYNEIEPKDGYDVVSTINVNIQDIAHHALLAQLEKYKAMHGTVVVMEVKTGEIKAISNLGRTSGGKYYERLNYAVGESHEPGSTFKLLSMIAALEDNAVDTSDIIDTGKGVISFYGKKVTDSKHGGYGEISVSDVLVRSSNVGIVKIIDDFYGDQPEKFVNRLYNMGLNEKLGLSIKGEGAPYIPHPSDKENWSGITLQWMAYGYNVSMTPLQTLAFYNAVANDGELLRPRLIKEVRDWDKVIHKFDKEVLNPSICSSETLKKVRAMLENVVTSKYGTGHKLYSPNFSMAGKTGTAQKNYADKSKLSYISSFAGYFPTDDPKYSCIVVIHEPDKSVGYYGADVSGPVFKAIAQKIYINSPLIETIEELNKEDQELLEDYKAYYAKVKQNNTIIPDVKGMSGMDAISILENLGLQVKIHGSDGGKVQSQSVESGAKVKSNQTIVLKLT